MMLKGSSTSELFAGWTQAIDRVTARAYVGGEVDIRWTKNLLEVLVYLGLTAR